MRDRDPNWFIGPPVRCALCVSCRWDLRSIPDGSTTPTQCLFGGPYAGTIPNSAVDAEAVKRYNASCYFVDPKFERVAYEKREPKP